LLTDDGIAEDWNAAAWWNRLTTSFLASLVDVMVVDPDEGYWTRWERSLARWARYPEVDRRQIAAAQWALWSARCALGPADGASLGLNDRDWREAGASKLAPPESPAPDRPGPFGHWIASCVAWFREQHARESKVGEAVAPPRSVSVPVALFAEAEGEDRGYLADLVVEVVDLGGRFVARHPEDLFVREPDSDFCRAMDDAFAGACQCVDPRSHRQRGARWRLLQRGRSIPVHGPAGRSASGAAARAFWHALHDPIKHPDPILVLAQVSATDPTQLESVVKVSEKVRAAALDYRGGTPARPGAIDTIVVGTPEDRMHAEDGLRMEPDLGPFVRVIQL
jgi:hypothetical protein